MSWRTGELACVACVVTSGVVLLAQTPAQQQAPVFRGGTTVVPLTASSITVTADAMMLPKMGLNSEVRVEIRIDASQLAFTAAAGARTGQIEIQVAAGDARERTVGESNKRVDLTATDAVYADWLKTGIRQVMRVTVPEKPKYIKVVVYDYGSDRLGSAMIAVK